MSTPLTTNLSPLTAATHPIRAIAQPGIDAVRKLWLPFLLIQLCGLLVVIAYFRSPGFAAFCGKLGDAKAAGGLPLTMLAMAISASIVPEAFKFIAGVDRTFTRQRLRDLTFAAAVFAVAGVYVDAFYTFMADVFGDRLTLSAVAGKVLADQLLYTPIVGLPWLAICYTLREHRYRVGQTVRSLGVAWYISRVATLLLPCWAFWFPMTSLMYSLPASLTFTFGAIANAASATILIAVAGRKSNQPT